MKDLEQLVAQIGDAFMERLDKGADQVVSAPAPVCGCGSVRSETAIPGAFHATRAAATVPGLSNSELETVCRAAQGRGWGSLTVFPYQVAEAARLLNGTSTSVAAAVALPHGAAPTSAKLSEVESCLRLGAAEVALTLNHGALRSDCLDAVHAELKTAAGIAHARDACFTVMLEPALLSDSETATAMALAVLAGADAVKAAFGVTTHAKPEQAVLENLHKLLAGSAKLIAVFDPAVAAATTAAVADAVEALLTPRSLRAL